MMDSLDRKNDAWNVGHFTHSTTAALLTLRKRGGATGHWCRMRKYDFKKANDTLVDKTSYQ